MPKEPQECCGNCRFHNRLQGDCRRYPPAVIVMEDSATAEFPDVSPSDYCGEWKEKE